MWRGNIPKTARAFGYEATGSDIADRGFGETGVDCLTDERPRKTIIFNPPGDPKGQPPWRELTIAHALKVATAAVAVIVPIPCLAGQDHYDDFFSPYPPYSVHICSERPSMPPGGTDIPAKGGTTDYTWIVWRRNRAGKWARRSFGTVID